MNQKYTETQKQQAITDYYHGKSVELITLETEISKSTLYTWIRDFHSTCVSGNRALSQKDMMLMRQRIAKMENIVAVLKAVPCTASSSLQEKLSAAESLYGQYSVRVLCDALEISRGTFYNHMLRNKKGNSTYAKKREEMRIEIKRIYDENNQIFGARKIQAILQNEGYRASEKLIAALMSEMGIFSLRTTAKKDYEKQWPKKENRNILQRKFQVNHPNQAWVSDVTYFKIDGVGHNICTVIDLFSRKVIAYKVSKKNSTQLITSTFKAAYRERLPIAGLVFHSDRGSQYLSHAFCKLLKNREVIQSLSAPGRPYDNAVAESFFASLKKECLYRRDCRHESEFLDAVSQYIQFYNCRRPHTALNYKTPEQFEELYVKNKSDA